MKISKKAISNVPLEEAHGGSGSRRLYIDKGQTANKDIEAMTHGYLSAGKEFDWHDHPGVEEIMYCLSGEGYVEDEDGKYEYQVGDLFIFPPDIKHKIAATVSSEYVFFRIKV